MNSTFKKPCLSDKKRKSLTLNIDSSPKLKYQKMISTNIMEDFIIEERAIKLEGYTYIEDLGSGTHSIVQLYLREEDKKLFAVKIFYDSKNLETLKSCKQEFKILQDLSHRNIVKVSHSVEKDQKYAIFFHYSSSLTLKRVLKKIQRSDKFLLIIKIIFKQILEAIRYLNNEKKISHRDLKPQNILISPEDFRIEIVDFGSAFSFENSDDSDLVSPNGTLQYLPPEIRSNCFEVDPTKIDIYSVGIILSRLTKNFSSHSTLMLTNEDIELRKMVFKMVDENIKTRASIDEILKSPFFSKEIPNEEVKQLAGEFFDNFSTCLDLSSSLSFSDYSINSEGFL